MSRTFHNDSRGTVVLIDKKVYELIPSVDWTYEKLLHSKPSERPHARILNEIPNRSPAEQVAENQESDQLHELCSPCLPVHKNVTLKKAAKLGIDIPDKVKELLELKEKTKDPEEKKKIRKQLRSLDYKRYLEKGGESDAETVAVTTSQG